MNLNIRERYQKVLRSCQEIASRSVRTIAKATGISKSSVHRHLTPHSARNGREKQLRNRHREEIVALAGRRKEI